MLRLVGSSMDSPPWSILSGCLPPAPPARHLIGLAGETMRSWGKSRFAVGRVAVLLAASTVLANAPAVADNAASSAADLEAVRFGSWGVDLSARDDKVKPGDDFQRYA